MTTFELTYAPSATAAMLIRRPAAEVFEAFIDPTITSKFWFSKGSGRLEAGKEIQWDWEMYGFSVQVKVKSIDDQRRILVEWSSYGAPTTVEWIFTALSDNTTFVGITNSGFSGGGDDIVKQAVDSAGGFAFVLAGLKALLEHNVSLNLVADHAPKGIKTP